MSKKKPDKNPDDPQAGLSDLEKAIMEAGDRAVGKVSKRAKWKPKR